MKTSAALGFFDGVHLGHRRVIETAVQLAGDCLDPAVFTFTMRAKRPAGKKDAGLLTAPEEKIRLLRQMGIERVYCPDFSQFHDFSGEEFVQKILIEALDAAVVVCGEDFRFGKGAACDKDDLQRLCEEKGIRCVVLKEVTDHGQKISSTRVRQALLAGDMEEAAHLLGRHYTVSYPVQKGKQLGRKMHFPTINQPFPDDVLVPRYGVYAAVAQIGETSYPAVCNIGLRPTVEADETPRAETYIMDFSGDLYGQNVPVRLLSFLREEQIFSSVEDLQEQIGKDAEKARKIVKKALQPGCAVV